MNSTAREQAVLYPPFGSAAVDLEDTFSRDRWADGPLIGGTFPRDTHVIEMFATLVVVSLIRSRLQKKASSDVCGQKQETEKGNA